MLKGYTAQYLRSLAQSSRVTTSIETRERLIRANRPLYEFVGKMAPSSSIRAASSGEMETSIEIPSARILTADTDECIRVALDDHLPGVHVESTENTNTGLRVTLSWYRQIHTER